jgi:hypothetical protein
MRLSGVDGMTRLEWLLITGDYTQVPSSNRLQRLIQYRQRYTRLHEEWKLVDLLERFLDQ